MVWGNSCWYKLRCLSSFLMYLWALGGCSSTLSTPWICHWVLLEICPHIFLGSVGRARHAQATSRGRKPSTGDGRFADMNGKWTILKTKSLLGKVHNVNSYQLRTWTTKHWVQWTLRVIDTLVITLYICIVWNEVSCIHTDTTDLTLILKIKKS